MVEVAFPLVEVASPLVEVASPSVEVVGSLGEEANFLVVEGASPLEGEEVDFQVGGQEVLVEVAVPLLVVEVDSLVEGANHQVVGVVVPL